MQQRQDDKILLYCEVEDSGIGIRNVMDLKPGGYLLKSMEPKKLHAAIDDFFVKKQIHFFSHSIFVCYYFDFLFTFSSAAALALAQMPFFLGAAGSIEP